MGEEKNNVPDDVTCPCCLEEYMECDCCLYEKEDEIFMANIWDVFYAPKGTVWICMPHGTSGIME